MGILHISWGLGQWSFTRLLIPVTTTWVFHRSHFPASLQFKPKDLLNTLGPRCSVGPSALQTQTEPESPRPLNYGVLGSLGELAAEAAELQLAQTETPD